MASCSTFITALVSIGGCSATSTAAGGNELMVAGLRSTSSGVPALRRTSATSRSRLSSMGPSSSGASSDNPLGPWSRLMRFGTGYAPTSAPSFHGRPGSIDPRSQPDGSPLGLLGEFCVPCGAGECGQFVQNPGTVEELPIRGHRGRELASFVDRYPRHLHA